MMRWEVKASLLNKLFLKYIFNFFSNDSNIIEIYIFFVSL